MASTRVAQRRRSVTAVELFGGGGGSSRSRSGSASSSQPPQRRGSVTAAELFGGLTGDSPADRPPADSHAAAAAAAIVAHMQETAAAKARARDGGRGKDSRVTSPAGAQAKHRDAGVAHRSTERLATWGVPVNTLEPLSALTEHRDAERGGAHRTSRPSEGLSAGATTAAGAATSTGTLGAPQRQATPGRVSASPAGFSIVYEHHGDQLAGGLSLDQDISDSASQSSCADWEAGRREHEAAMRFAALSVADTPPSEASTDTLEAHASTATNSRGGGGRDLGSGGSGGYAGQPTSLGPASAHQRSTRATHVQRMLVTSPGFRLG
jgi:hypothetical protein